MTVAVPEAATVVRSTVVPGSSTYELRGARRARRARASAPSRDRSRLRETAATAAGSYAGQARRVGQRARIPGDRNYQGIILAEFLVAMLLVALSPIAAGGSPNAQAKNSPSPYDANDLKQLVAVGAAYFILALVSSGNRGRLAAWLGGLILIAIAMSKAGQGKLAGIFSLAGAEPAQSASGPADQTV